MKCRQCGKEVKGKSCSYCNFIVDKNDFILVDSEAMRIYKNKKNIFIVLLLITYVLSILLNFVSGLLLPTSIIIFVFLFYYLFSGLKQYEMFTKKIFAVFLFFTLISVFLNSIPLIQAINQEIRLFNASDKYEELLGIDLPDIKAERLDYYSNHNTGSQSDMFVFKINDSEKEQLLKNENFKVVTDSDRVYNIFMSSVGKYYDTVNEVFLIYDKLGNRFDYIVDLSIYNYVIVVITEDNTLFICDMFKAEPNSED